jgi:hypothetical protein
MSLPPLRFKDFEIRPTVSGKGEPVPGKWEVVTWYTMEHPIEVFNAKTGKEELRDRFCYVVAFIEWNEKEPCWEFCSVGTRFLEDYVDGVCEWILKVLELFDVTRRAGESNEV